MRSLDLLVAPFRALAHELIDVVLPSRGVIVRPYNTQRSPWEQARLWRQSRSRETIEAKIEELVNADAPTLATYLRMVGPQSGKPVTNAPPGLSWHNHGEAMDCFVLGPHGEAIWTADDPGYVAYAEEAQRLGLTAGRYFKMVDADHVQLRKEASPNAMYPLAVIDEMMRSKFGLDESQWTSRDA